VSGSNVQLLSAALRYAGQGWPVFPCRPRRKEPATRHGLQDATTDTGLISGWWGQWPDANVAIRTGVESGLVVLDVDGEDGAESLRALAREHGELPRTATVRTPRGGLHFYFAHPGGTVRNSAGRLGVGLDVRGDGGYVVAPPSTDPAGRRYDPVQRVPVAAAPAYLVAEAERTASTAAAPAATWVGIIRHGLDEGERNASLTRLVGHLLRRDVDAELAVEIAHLVAAHRCHPPLPAEEVDRIVESIASREFRRRAGGRG
jgi:hypothetical protein